MVCSQRFQPPHIHTHIDTHTAQPPWWATSSIGEWRRAHTLTVCQLLFNCPSNYCIQFLVMCKLKYPSSIPYFRIKCLRLSYTENISHVVNWDVQKSLMFAFKRKYLEYIVDSKNLDICRKMIFLREIHQQHFLSSNFSWKLIPNIIL